MREGSVTKAAAETSTVVAVPATLTALLNARLDQLDTPERSVLERGAVHVRNALLRLPPEFPPLLFERALEPLGPLRQRVLQDVVEGTTTLPLLLLLLLLLSHVGLRPLISDRTVSRLSGDLHTSNGAP